MWQYGDYEAPGGNTEASDSERLSRLRLHMGEVNQKITATMSADGYSRDSSSLITYLQMLQTRLAQLEASPDTMSAGGMSSVRFRQG